MDDEDLSKLGLVVQSIAQNMIVSEKRGPAFQFDLDDSLLTKVANKLHSNVAATIWKLQ